MSLMPQPPPDVPAPPAGPEALRSRRKMGLIYWLGGLSILGLMLLGAGTPVVLKSRKASDRTEALNNVRQIGLGLFEFEADYGSFPSVTTIPDVKSRTGTALTLGDGSSNQLFRQLLVTYLKSEKPFYAKIPGAKRPNDVFHSDATALTKGECMFSYITGLRSSDDPDLPIAMTPMVRGTQTFSHTPALGSHAVILRLDNSATILHIRRDNGHASVVGGLTLFDPKVWGGVKLDLRWQE